MFLRTMLQYITACFVPRIHFGQITSNHMLVTVIENLKKTTISRVSEARVSVAPSPFPGSGISGWANVWECVLSVVSSGKVGWRSETVSPFSCANRLPFPYVLPDVTLPSDKPALMLSPSFTLGFL